MASKTHECCMYGGRCKPATVQIKTRNGGREWYCDECAKVVAVSKAFHSIIESVKEV